MISFDPKKVTTVVFDWGGVFGNPAEPFASLALQEALGGMDVDTIADKARDLYDGHYRGEFSSEDFYRKILKHYGLEEAGELTPANLAEAYIGSYTLYPETLEIARRLKAKYTVGLISNLSPVMRDHIREAHRTRQIFDPEVYSCDPNIQTIKPGPEIFLKFLELAEKEATECLFIDDGQKNLDAAATLGFQTLHFTTPEQFAEDISPL